MWTRTDIRQLFVYRISIILRKWRGTFFAKTLILFWKILSIKCKPLTTVYLFFQLTSLKFDDRIYSSKETGLLDKWVECSLLNAYKFFVGDGQGYDIKSKDEYFYMDVGKLKVVLGSYLVGMLFAFIALVIERYSNKLIPMNPKIDQAIKVIKVTNVKVAKYSTRNNW